ncbi:MAG: class I SAM-dependent methyltransferase, partial [Aestuariibacter sp.]|nr:class I SAM-dependent methyltransferase [Aestuariibacter sp.]
QRNELNEVLRTAGLTDIRWHMPDDSGYYQPIVTALKSG